MNSKDENIFLKYGVIFWLIFFGALLAIPVFNLIALPIVLIAVALMMGIFFWRQRRAH